MRQSHYFISKNKNVLVHALILILEVNTELNQPWIGDFFFDLPDVHAVDVWVGAVRGEVGRVGELVGVPHELVHDLRKLDRVRRGTCAAAGGTGSRAVCHVALVVRAVEVLAIPASIIHTDDQSRGDVF